MAKLFIPNQITKLIIETMDSTHRKTMIHLGEATKIIHIKRLHQRCKNKIHNILRLTTTKNQLSSNQYLSKILQTLTQD